ncbi:MAG: class I SAM-dependent methyltransferase [bacterium]
MKQSIFSKNWLVHKLGEKYIREASRYARGSLLDVGCGEKPYYHIYSERVSSYVGLDLPKTNPASADVHADALSLPFKDGSFDTVVSFQVLEHVREPDAMVREATRVLSPGGYAIVSAPHMWGLHEVPHDYFRFTEYGFRHLFESNNLELVNIQAMAGYWVTAGTRFCYYLEGLRKRPLAPVFGLMFLIIQTVSAFLDRLHRVETDTWNYIAVGKKKC